MTDRQGDSMSLPTGFARSLAQPDCNCATATRHQYQKFLIQALPGFGPGTRLRLHEPSRAFDTTRRLRPARRAVQGGWRLAATECVARPGQRFVRRAGAGADLRHRPVGHEPPPQGAGPGRAGGDAPRGQRDLLPTFAAPGRTHRRRAARGAAGGSGRTGATRRRAGADRCRARPARGGQPGLLRPRGGQVPGPAGPDRRTAAIP